MASKVKIIKFDELQKMHTGTLMKRRTNLLKCEESFELSDRFGYEAKSSTAEIIEFKNTSEWSCAYKELKSLLATRENLPNKQERKEIRQAKAKS